MNILTASVDQLIPDSNQFVNTVPQPTQQGLDNFLGNVSALQDPSGTLQRMQAEQIAKASAAFKMEGIDAKYKELALKAINDYQKGYQDKFNANKGMNRLTLGADQLLDDSVKYKAVLSDLNAAKNLSEDYKKTMERVANDVIRNAITSEDYKLFEQDYNERLKNAKSLGNMPSAHAVYNNYLAGKPYDWAQMSKEVTQAAKDAEATKGFGQEGGVFYNTETKNPSAIADAMMSTNAKFRKFWLDANGGDIVAARNAATEYVGKYAKDNKTYAGQVRKPDNININTGNGFDNRKGLYGVAFVPSNLPMQTGNKEKTVASEVMNLESIGKQVPWVGQVKGEYGNQVMVNGFITRIIKDNHGGMYARIQGNYDDADGQQKVIVRDIPYTLEMNARLHEEKIDVDPIRQRFGASKNGSTPTPKQEAAPEKTYRMQDALIQYQGYTQDQIRKAMSKLGYKEVK